jgi:hypothetical protein
MGRELGFNKKAGIGYLKDCFVLTNRFETVAGLYGDMIRSVDKIGVYRQVSNKLPLLSPAQHNKRPGTTQRSVCRVVRTFYPRKRTHRLI